MRRAVVQKITLAEGRGDLNCLQVLPGALVVVREINPVAYTAKVSPVNHNLTRVAGGVRKQNRPCRGVEHLSTNKLEPIHATTSRICVEQGYRASVSVEVPNTILIPKSSIKCTGAGVPDPRRRLASVTGDPLATDKVKTLVFVVATGV